MLRESVLQDIEKMVSEVTGSSVEIREEMGIRNSQRTEGEENIGLSSLDTVELIIKLEQTYGIEITEEEAPRVTHNLKTLIDFILFEKHMEEIDTESIRKAKAEIFGT